MPTFANGRAAMVALQSHLQSTLDGDYSSDFSSYGGVDVVLRMTEDTDVQQVGKPMIELAVQSDVVSSVAGLRRKERDCIVIAWIKANDFSGAQIGAANAEGSDTQLSRALLDILSDDYETLRDAGLEGLVCGDGSEAILPESDDRPEEHRIQHVITFQYTRP